MPCRRLDRLSSLGDGPGLCAMTVQTACSSDELLELRRLLDHHQALSSLPSIARRCSREHVSQKRRRRPFSTAVVQVRVFPSSASCRPQKSQVRMHPPYGCSSHSRTRTNARPIEGFLVGKD